MPALLHLSDLHLAAPATEAQRALLGLLFRAVAREIRGGEAPRAAIVTGDVFDTSSAEHAAAAATLRELCGGLRAAIGPGIPILLLPGNHDRRRLGVLGPEDLSLFRALSRAAGPDVHVLGNETPFCSELVPPEVHGLPLHVVAYDSTVLPGGLVSAGGIVRQEDLLQISAEIDAREGPGEPRRPLLLLVHHHLVPTPVTDLSHIELSRLPRSVGFLFEHGLRHVIAHGDREELTMTALGAGTALSTLCALGRPVLVLHGHKHYPTARLLKGVRQDEGDILIGSAGSAGRAERWRPTELPKEARVWPSFNRIAIDGARVTIESVAFSDRKPDKPFQRRRLVEAAWSGARWDLCPVPVDTDERPNPLELDESVVSLWPNSSDGGATWDAEVRRTLRWAAPGAPRPADDVVEGLPDGALHVFSGGRWTRMPLPAKVRVPAEGHLAYRIERAACRRLDEGQRRYGKLAAHEWMGLLVRHASAVARLTLARLPVPGEPPGRAAPSGSSPQDQNSMSSDAEARARDSGVPAWGEGVAARSARRRRPFGSMTSLTSGEERPVRLSQAEDGLSLEVRDCPPLTLLRIYWPLPDR